MVALSESKTMARNLNQFSEFQHGFILSIADAVGGYILWTMDASLPTVTIRSKSDMAFFKWRSNEEPMIWSGTAWITLKSANWTLPEYLYFLNNPNDQLRRVADALNDLINSGSFDRLGDSAQDAAAKFFDSLSDATVDDEDEDEDDC